MNQEAPRKRVVRNVEVVRKEVLTPEMVRVIFTGDDLRELPEMPLTDHYVKILFAPAGADYGWPFDPDHIRETQPKELWPVTRTYTVRWYDAATNELAIDFVIHGDSGLAGPWAARAEPGDRLGFNGPGGAWAPDLTADAVVLVGDEAAIPAIAAALDSLPEGTRAEAFVEVRSADCEQPLRSGDGITIHWVHRGSEAYGVPLAAAVRTAALPEGRLSVFVHGNAGMVKDLRRYFFIERQLPRADVSISGYWRTDYTEDLWQSTKRDFMAQVEAEEAAAVAAAQG